MSEGNQQPIPRPGPRQREPPPKMTSEEAAKKRIPEPDTPSTMRSVISSYSRVTAQRVRQECAPYLEEGRLINQRVALLTREIESIGLQLDRFRITLIERHGLLQGSTQAQTHIPQKDIFSLQTLYALERVQKEEERMRLQDRLTEINEIIRSICIKYEDTRQLGGKRSNRKRSNRRRSKTHKGVSLRKMFLSR